MEAFLNTLNDIIIALIPKCENRNLCKNPESMQDLCPISLCNVVYKIVAKMLPNRLKPILKGYFHGLKQKTHGRQGHVALKIDISKAYDRVNWEYLRLLMIKMGFDDKWVRWIMLCVRTVKYSVKICGKLVGPILPNPGVRKGTRYPGTFLSFVLKDFRRWWKRGCEMVQFMGLGFVEGLPVSPTYYLQVTVCSFSKRLWMNATV